jgi:aspartate oxidase
VSERRVIEFANLAECSNCGTRGAFDLGATCLCAECLAGPEDAEQVKEERDFLRDENAKLQRMVKTRDNKIKHLQHQLSENRLRRRLDKQNEVVKEQGQMIQRLKTEKVALHEYIERQSATRGNT